MEWEVFARSIAPGAKMDALALRDHAPEILLATVQDMKSSSIRDRTIRQVARHNDKHAQDGAATGSVGAELNGASELHAIGRIGFGVRSDGMISEYGTPCQRPATLA